MDGQRDNMTKSNRQVKIKLKKKESLKRNEKETYITQILHDVKEILRLLVIVAGLLDSLADNEVLRDLGPHLATGPLGGRGPRRLADGDALVTNLLDLDVAVARPAPVAILVRGVVDLDAEALAVAVGRLAHGGAAHGRAGQGGAAVALGDELGPPHAVVPLPGDLGGAAADAVHGDALRAGRHVDDAPVARGAVPGLAHAAAGVDLARDVLGLVVPVLAAPGLGVRPPPRRLRHRDPVPVVAPDHHVLVVVRRPRLRTRARCRPRARPRVRVPHVDVGFAPRAPDVDVRLALVSVSSGAGRSGCGRRRRRPRSLDT